MRPTRIAWYTAATVVLVIAASWPYVDLGGITLLAQLVVLTFLASHAWKTWRRR